MAIPAAMGSSSAMVDEILVILESTISKSSLNSSVLKFN